MVLNTIFSRLDGVEHHLIVKDANGEIKPSDNRIVLLTNFLAKLSPTARFSNIRNVI